MSVQPFQVAGSGRRGATGHIRLTVAMNDADTVTVTTPNGAVTYEFDNNANVVAGNVPVIIGGTATLSAAALRAAIVANQTDLYASVGPVTTTNDAVQSCVDLKVHSAVAAGLTLATVSAGRALVQDNADEAGPRQVTRVIRRVVTAEDVLRDVIVIDPGLTTIVGYSIDLWTAEPGGNVAANATRIAWVGASLVSVTDGRARLLLDNRGITDFVAGHVLYVQITGDVAATDVSG